MTTATKLGDTSGSNTDLSGPKQSTSKEKDQTCTIPTFHPGLVLAFSFIWILNLLIAAITASTNIGNFNDSHTDTTEKAGTSKAGGKKRAVEEDDEATVTDNNAPISGKPTKKKKIQHK